MSLRKFKVNARLGILHGQAAARFLGDVEDLETEKDLLQFFYSETRLWLEQPTNLGRAPTTEEIDHHAKIRSGYDNATARLEHLGCEIDKIYQARVPGHRKLEKMYRRRMIKAFKTLRPHQCRAATNTLVQYRGELNLR